MSISIYGVFGKASANVPEHVEHIGYYKYEETAQRVAAFVREAYQKELIGGIAVWVEDCLCNLEDSLSALEIDDDLSKSQSLKIIETLDLNEFRRLTHLSFQQRPARVLFAPQDTPPNGASQ